MEGTPFGRYRLLELLGGGGMGEVWRAHDTATDRIVAVKVLPSNLAEDETFVARFRREAHAAAQLNNPHVVPIHTYGEIEGRLYVDMRLIEGRDLQSVLADGPLDRERAVRIVEAVGKALYAAHRVGLVHRDVKPSNILIDEDDFAYLIDFGIARADKDTSRLTSTGAMIGTWHYMAPERLGGHKADARSDIYALACVLHECLTGSRPFPGNSVESQVAAHLTAQPPRPSIARADVPSGMDAVIERGMAKEPDERYQTPVELARAARDAITLPGSRPALTRPPEPPTDLMPNVLSTPTVRHAAPSGPAAYPARPRWRRKTVVISAIAILCVVTVAAAITVALVGNQDDLREIPLPFTDIRSPVGVAVDDSAQTVYVTDGLNRQVLALALAEFSSQERLGFKDLTFPDGVAVGTNGTVYVADYTSGRVVRLAPSGNQTALPFARLTSPVGVAVDKFETVYVTDTRTNRVLALPKDAPRSTDLTAFEPGSDGDRGLTYPRGVAVDSDLTVYVADTYNNRVLKLPKGAPKPTELAFVGLSSPLGVAVDDRQTVYVTDSGNNRVVTLAQGTTNQAELPFKGLNTPVSVAVDKNRTVFVTDSGTKQVWMLTTESG